MKRQYITAVILASMLLAACGAMPGESAVTSAETTESVTEAAAASAEETEEETKEETKEEETGDIETETEEETAEEAESEEETEEAADAGSDEEETEEAGSEDEDEADSEDDEEESEDEDAESEEDETESDDDETESDEDETESDDDEAESDEDEADSEDEDADSDEGSEDEEAESEDEEEENDGAPRAYSATMGRSAAREKEAARSKTDKSEEEAESDAKDEADEETEDDEEYENFWDMFPDASDGEYDNFWDMIADGDYDGFEDMFPEEDIETDKDRHSPGGSSHSRDKADARSHEDKSAEEAAVEEAEDEEDEEDEFAASEGLVFKSSRDGTATITGIGTCSDSYLVIPGKSPSGDVVTAIADGAFDHAEGIETVVFENIDIEIGSKAFAESSVQNLLIYDSIVTIDEDAFLYCEDLSYIAVDESELITAAYSFDSALNGADLVFSDSIVLLDDESFVYSGVRSILAEDCSIMIGEDTFDYCEDIETLEFVDCLVDIGPYAFFCTGNRMEVLFEDCDVTMEEDAFAFSDIVNLEINGSTVQIGEDAFDYCEAIESIIVRSSVVDTDAYAFYGCGDKAKVVFENGEITLGKDAFAFADITALKIIRCEADIGQEAFKSCVNLERADICSGNINIGRRAFYHCTGLKEISLSDDSSGPHTIVIGDDAFEFCGLEKVMLGKGSIEIGSGAFEYCEDLKDVKIRGELESVGRNAFLRCHDELAINYDGKMYDAKTIQDAVKKEDEGSSQPSQRSMPQVEQRSTPQPDQDSGRQSGQNSDRQAQQPGRRSDEKAELPERQSASGSGQPSTPRIQAPRSYTPGTSGSAQGVRPAK